MYDEENNSNTLPTMGKTPDERFKMIDPRIDPYRESTPHYFSLDWTNGYMVSRV